MRTHWHLRVGVAVVAAMAAVTLIGAPSAGAAGSGIPQIPANVKVTVLADAVQLADKYLGGAPLKLRYQVAEGIISVAKGFLGPGTDPVGIPGTIVGGLNLDQYCVGLGYSSSYTPDPGNEAPGAAYTWSCVSASGVQTPLVMQNACFAMYPSQVTIAYPQDVNNAYSWVCIAPTTGTFTNPGGTTYSLQASDGSVVLILGTDGSIDLAVATTGGSDGTVVIQSNGSGYIAEEGGGGTLPI